MSVETKGSMLGEEKGVSWEIVMEGQMDSR